MTVDVFAKTFYCRSDVMTDLRLHETSKCAAQHQQDSGRDEQKRQRRIGFVEQRNIKNQLNQNSIDRSGRKAFRRWQQSSIFGQHS